MSASPLPQLHPKARSMGQSLIEGIQYGVVIFRPVLEQFQEQVRRGLVVAWL